MSHSAGNVTRQIYGRIMIDESMRESLSIKEIASITGGKLIGDGDQTVDYLVTDSRSLNRTEYVLFVAISGDHHDGNDFIREVYGKGVRCFLCDKMPEKYLPEASYCLVDESLTALQKIAAHRRRNFKGQVIGITGSNGKTIVKEWLYQLLYTERSVIRSPRSYNSQLGVPLSVWQLSGKFNLGIIEAGISRPDEMEKLRPIVLPDIGILTNIGPAHSENFVSDTQKLKEKLVLFKDCRKLIYNKELMVNGTNIQHFLTVYQFEKISWSLEGNAKYAYKLLKSTKDSCHLLLERDLQKNEFTLPYSDSASIENALQAITTVLELGVEMEKVLSRIQRLEPVEMRLETLNGINGSTLVSDVYNSDLAGLSVALDVLQQQKKHPRKVVILSDVFQSGMKDEDLYKEVAELLKFRGIDQVVCIGDAISGQRRFFPDGTLFFSDTNSFISAFDLRNIDNSAVLIKGARSFRFEKISGLLQLQYHKTVLEISVNELASNLNYFRSLISPETRIMVMVKALSYGSGAEEIAGFLQHEKVDYLAVAFPDEGIRLRNAGLLLPVMVMHADKDDYRSMIEYDLEPEIFSREGMEAFIKHAKFMGKSDHPVHLKFDTGMHRLGFEETDVSWILDKLSSENINVKSIFTHLAGSEDPSLDDFSREQVAKFNLIVGQIKEIIDNKVLVHVLNSSGIERFPEYQFDMVRIGIGLYGLGNSSKLHRVSTFKTVISQLREVKAGDTIGYGRKGKVTTDSRIATIPVGYADGLDRRLGNGNYSFFVNGKKVPTIGNICMDMTMLDVSNAEAGIGDTVELFGKNLPVDQMADQLGTIVYEILTSLPERVKRVYIRE